MFKRGCRIVGRICLTVSTAAVLLLVNATVHPGSARLLGSDTAHAAGNGGGNGGGHGGGNGGGNGNGGGGNSGGNGGGQGNGGNSGGQGGNSGGQGGNAGGNGSGGSQGGGQGNGSAGNGAGTSSGNSGKGDTAGTAGRSASPPGKSTPQDDTPVSVDAGPSGIGVRHKNGIVERVVKGRYQMLDARQRMIVSRKATPKDVARIKALLR